MNENTMSNHFSERINVKSCTVKSEPPKFEYRKACGLSRKKSTTNSILPRENAFDIEKCMKEFDKKMDKFFEKLFDATQEFSRGIRNIIRGYLHFLMLCALIAIGYIFMVSMVEENPNIIVTLPNITNLLSSMKVLAGYATDFLNWNFTWSTHFIEEVISEVNALIS